MKYFSWLSILLIIIINIIHYADPTYADPTYVDPTYADPTYDDPTYNDNNRRYHGIRPEILKKLGKTRAIQDFEAKLEDIGHVFDIANDPNVIDKIITSMKQLSIFNEPDGTTTT